MLAFKIETNTQCNKLKRLDLKLLFKDANAFHITAVNVLKTMVMEFERDRERERDSVLMDITRYNFHKRFESCKT